jgi:hypothetical protein
MADTDRPCYGRIDIVINQCDQHRTEENHEGMHEHFSLLQGTPFLCTPPISWIDPASAQPRLCVTLSYSPSVYAPAGYQDPPITLADEGETSGSDGTNTLVLVCDRLIGIWDVVKCDALRDNTKALDRRRGRPR